MTLVIDNRYADEGVHVLIVGVSDYQNLPEHDDPPREDKWYLNKLTSPALSALSTFDLIRTSALRLPLKTVRLLLSPSPSEIAANAAVATTGAARATRAAFEQAALDWRNDATGNPKDMTIFYFAGHGLQRGPEEGVLLLEDFLAPGPPLAKCFEIGDIRNGMAPSPSFAQIAMTQFYFVDACLTRQETQKKFVNPQVPNVFGAELNLVDRREAPVIFSTVDGAIALGRKGRPSHFADALSLALQRAAEEPEDHPTGTVWPVTSLTIKTALDAYYRKNKLGQVKMGGVVGSPIIRYLDRPPDVDIAILLQPNNPASPYGLSLIDDSDTAVCNCNPPATGEAQFTVKAGVYRTLVDCSVLQVSPYRSPRKFLTQRVPWPWIHNLSSLVKPLGPQQ